MDGGLLTAAVSLVEEVDKKILVVLRDGRKLVGIMRSYDQFANVVLEDTVERVFVGNKFCQKPLGVFIIRGENVVLISEIDIDLEYRDTTAGKIQEISLTEFLELSANENADSRKKKQNLDQFGYFYDDEI